jgi:pyruvate-ferredoxin/flavodoxin oxidoreductase
LDEALRREELRQERPGVVELNYKAIDAGPEGLREVKVDPAWVNLSAVKKVASKADSEDTYFDEYVDTIDKLDGDELPTSEFLKYELLDGTMEPNITFRQHRAIADMVPQWNPNSALSATSAPSSARTPRSVRSSSMRTNSRRPRKSSRLRSKDPMPALPGQRPQVPDSGLEHELRWLRPLRFRVLRQQSPARQRSEDKNLALKMVEAKSQFAQQDGADYLYKQTTYKSGIYPLNTVKGVGFMMPYMEVSGACAGCGEAPYYRLVTQLFGKDMLVANATGCSSIYCGSLRSRRSPRTPTKKDRLGPTPYSKITPNMASACGSLPTTR